MAETKVGWYRRGQLKAHSNAIFRRLVMDKDRENFSGFQGLFFLAAVAIPALVIGSAIWLLAGPTGVSAWLASIAGASAPVTATEITIGLIAIGLVAAAALLGKRLRFLNELAFDGAGWLLVRLRRLNHRSAAAWRNINHVVYWLRHDPGRVAAEVAEYRGKRCEQLLPSNVAGALKKLSDETDPTSFVLVRGLFERKYGFKYAQWDWRTPRPDPQDPEKVGRIAGRKNSRQYYIEARAVRNAIKMSICFDTLNVELRDEAAGGGKWMWDYYSKHDYQQVPLWDEHDLPLRFRTASPHLKWPDRERADSDGELPLFRAFSGLENPQKLPLLLLELKSVIAEMPHSAAEIGLESGAGALSEPEQRRAAARALSALAKYKVKLISRRDYKTMQPILGRDATDAPLLMRLDGGSREFSEDRVDDLLGADWGARWDPARIEWSSIDAAGDTDLLRAIAIFLNAINLAMRSKPGDVAGAGHAHVGHGSAHSIVLKRGDVLFVDNRRTVIGRFEHHLTDMMAIRKLFLNQPAEWWIRRFYGFRKTKRAGGAEDQNDQRFSSADKPYSDFSDQRASAMRPSTRCWR
ncbi:MAG: hypothetical protein U5J99_11480 [Parvularculaceae bacterium]|nr:hypothetical protein [Parvularculaceae bacterium]